MVFFFEIRGGLTVYMGRDKFENEQLIEHGWPEDVWFHVDSYSSAHVYLRLPRGPLRKTFRETGLLDHLPPGALEDCCQLVKNNSIEGSKVQVDIVYTEWANLQKRADMDIGTIGFKDQSKVIKVRSVKRDRDIVKRVEKTRREEFPDLAAERAQRDHEQKQRQKAKAKADRKIKAQEEAARRAEKEARDYKHIMKEEAMQSNADAVASVDDEAAVEFEEGFM